MSRFLRPVISERLPSGTHFAELFLAPGPEHIGVTGDNSDATMFGFDWLLVWDRDDGLLHLYQERDGAWYEVTTDLPPVFASPVPEGARRWSLAFDQAARAILAYEDGAGIVRVTRWEPSSNSYVQNVSFAGHDPCVVMDASWSLSVPGSDVLLFYLSPDRERVLCRVQRDVYAVEHEIWDYGTPVILDRVIATPLRYQVLVSDVTGTPLPEMLLSALYPYLARGGANANAIPASAGAYVLTVLSAGLAEGMTITAGGPTSGDYADPLLEYSVGSEAINAAATGPSGGEYREPLLSHARSETLVIDGSAPTAGAYDLAVITSAHQDAPVSITATGPTGGTYATA